MAQQLHDPFRPCLLGLTPAIRQRIYLYLGVARWDGFHTVFDLDDPTDRVVFHGLLLSCRTIYNEASALLFSANRFVMRYRHNVNQAEGSLQPLRNLTAPSLASLTQLKIVLNQASCHHCKKTERYGDCCNHLQGPYAERFDPPSEGWCRRLHTTSHDSPLQSSRSSAAPMLDEWVRTAKYLSSRINPRTLELSLVCDMDQGEADLATQVVAPLALLPELKDCHVRLCRHPNDELAQIARNAALQACHKMPPKPRSPPSPAASRLLFLPRELRLHILEFTDLVTPWKEIMWNRVLRGYQDPVGNCTTAGGIRRQGGLAVYYDSIGCFCRRRHAAFSSTCRCWAQPTPLFLVCRALLEDARLVFFSQNRFVVSDTLASSINPHVAFDIFNTVKWPKHGRSWELPEYVHAQPPRSYPAERFAASQFLREVIPADCLRYLRFFEVVFPPYNHKCWPHDGHPALQDWLETIIWVRDKINTAHITLRLTMAGSPIYRPRHPDSRHGVTQAQGRQVLAGYDRILQPLARLGGEDGLARFYADFAWPWKWADWVDRKSVQMAHEGNSEAFFEWMKSNEEALNERAERFVLGDRYELLKHFSGSKGKRELRHWQLDCMPGI